jgi:soluble lytic murein transglycosylase-like protein
MGRESGFFARSAHGVASAALMLAALCAAPVAQADEWIYLQRDNAGLRSYTDVKPEGKYTKIARGRPTASASCFGLTAASLKQRAELYAPTIHKVASKHGLSPKLVSAVMRVESCYDARAVSRAGARGLMQLMPMTAAQLGVYDSFDPEQNIEGGVRYLASMLRRFNNDLHLGLAAYNAGPEAVEAYRGVPPYKETKSYVGRILKLYTS